MLVEISVQFLIYKEKNGQCSNVIFSPHFLDQNLVVIFEHTHENVIHINTYFLNINYSLLKKYPSR